MMLCPDQNHSGGDLPQFLLKLFGHNWGRGYSFFSFPDVDSKVNTPQTIRYSPSFFSVTSDVIRLTNSF